MHVRRMRGLQLFRATRVRCWLALLMLWPESLCYRLLVPREVVRDRNMGRSEVRAVPAEGPMQADFFRHQANNQLAGSQGQPARGRGGM